MKIERFQRFRVARRLARFVAVPVIALSLSLSLGVSGVASALFSQTPTPQTAAVSAAVLAAPTRGVLSASASSTSLPIAWTAPVGYAPTGYNLLRCTVESCTPAPITGGGCAGTLAVPNCTDNDPALTPGTTHTYEVIASFNDWLSAPSSTFSLATLGIPTTITSANSVNFVAGTAGSFTVTTTGVPSPPVITNANFVNSDSGCTISTPLAGVTFTDNGDGTATIASRTSSPAGTMTLCLNATNGVGTPATQKFTLTIGTPPPIDLPTLSFTDASGNNICPTPDDSKFVVPEAGTTLYVSRSLAGSSVSVWVVVTDRSHPQGLPPGSSLVIADNATTSSTGINVSVPGSNDGFDLTASAPGYQSVTCVLYKNGSQQGNNG